MMSRPILRPILLFTFLIVCAFSVSVDWAYMNPTGDQLLPVDAPTAVFFPDDASIYVFGGQTDNFTGEVNTARNTLFRYSILTNHVTQLNPYGSLPAPRCFHSSWARGSNTLYVAGGIAYDYFFETINVYNDIWSYNKILNTWTLLTFTGDAWPALASFVAQTGPDGTVYVFGGVDSSFVAHSDLYRFDLVHQTITHLSPSGELPPARYHAYSAPTEDGFFVTGGVGTDQQYIEDYWFFHFATQTWTQRPIPSGSVPLNRTHGVTGRVGDLFLLSLGDAVGGVNCPGIIFSQAPLNDTWVYSFADNAYTELFPRQHVPYDKYSGDVVAGLNVYSFGGYSFDINTCTQTFNRNILRAHFNEFFL